MQRNAGNIANRMATSLRNRCARCGMLKARTRPLVTRRGGCAELDLAQRIGRRAANDRPLRSRRNRTRREPCRHRLTRPHVVALCFLKIRRDPGVILWDREQLHQSQLVGQTIPSTTQYQDALHQVTNYFLAQGQFARRSQAAGDPMGWTAGTGAGLIPGYMAAFLVLMLISLAAVRLS